MSWGFVAGAAISVVGGVIQGDAAKSAAKQQANAANNATQAQLQMYNQNRDDQAPWRTAGTSAVNRLGSGVATGGEFDKIFDPSQLKDDPGYQFRLNEGMKGVQNSFAARGGALSGAALKGIDQYNQNFASNEYQNAYNRFQTDQGTRFNRLASVAGLGQTSVNQTGQNGLTTGALIGSNTIGAGNAAAAGTIGQGNAINGGLQTLGNYYLNRSGNASPLTSSSYGGGSLYDNGSTAGEGYDSLYSDRRLKENISSVDVNPYSGLTVYRFNYIGDDTPRMGYMADEVQDKYPNAVSSDADGYLLVNYAQLPGDV